MTKCLLGRRKETKKKVPNWRGRGETGEERRKREREEGRGRVIKE